MVKNTTLAHFHISQWLCGINTFAVTELSVGSEIYNNRGCVKTAQQLEGLKLHVFRVE